MPKDLSKGKETSQSLEIVLATLSILAKEDPKGKGPASMAAETVRSTKARLSLMIVMNFLLYMWHLCKF